MDHYVAIAIALIVGISIFELYLWLSFCCRQITRLAVRLLPKKDRRRYEEEWSGHLRDLPHSLVALSASVGFIVTALRFKLPAIGRAVRRWMTLTIIKPQLETELRFINLVWEMFRDDREGMILEMQKSGGLSVDEAESQFDQLAEALEASYPNLIGKIERNSHNISLGSSMSLMRTALTLRYFRYRYTLSVLARRILRKP